jgi:hypothetical protein
MLSLSKHDEATTSAEASGTPRLLEYWLRTGEPTMVQHKGNRFTGARINIDSQRFEDCAFDNCAIVYSGTGPYQLKGCTFTNCSFGFEGPAAMTVQFMTDFYKIAPQMIEATFDKIRLAM